MKREPRLQFSDADLAEPKLEKPIKRVKKAEAKADKAQAKIPKKTVVKKERGFDPATGKVKTQLCFEEVDKKKPPSKLTHAVQDAPANFVLSQVHREVRQSEDDNVGVEAAHKVEQAVESGGRLVQSAHRAHQLKPYRAAIRAEKKLERANLDALQKKAEIDSPTSNPISKWQQKQAIKKQYAAAKHNQAAQTTAKAAENTAKAAKKAAEKAEKAGKYVWEHRRGFAIAAAILLMLAFLLNGLSSCSVIMDGVGSGIAASTYPSQDADMLGAETQYCAMEAELQRLPRGVYRNIKKPAAIIEITVKNTANNIFLYFNNLYPIKANTVAINVPVNKEYQNIGGHNMISLVSSQRFNNALPTPNTRAAKVNFDKSKKYFEVFSLLFFIKS